MNRNTVTCSFSMDRDVYNAYKSIVAAHGENVKGNIVRYMQTVIRYGTPNAETIQALAEVEALEQDKNKRVYHSFDELLAEIAEDDDAI